MEVTTEEKIRAATKIVLKDRRLSDRVRIGLIQRQHDSGRYDVDLVVDASEFPRFVVDPTEALTAQDGERLTPESFVPFVRREILKLFGDAAT
jgi:hypothetical protein